MPSESLNTRIARREFVKQAGYAVASVAVLSQVPRALADDAPKQVVVAFLGVAHIHTPEYMRGLLKRSDVRVKYLWDHDNARALHASVESGVTKAEDPKTILADPEVKAVVICSETNLHKDLVLAAAAAGKNIFAEKPLGITAADSAQMADAIEKAKVIFTTGYFMRADPMLIFLKQQVDAGNFGKVTRVRGSNCHNGSLAHWFDKDWRWMADPRIAGVGAFGDLGTHALDILMWMFGDVETITADIKVVTGNYGDCDESGEALMRFKNGITGTLAAGWVDIENPITFMISGTEGHAWVGPGYVFFKSAHVDGADGTRPWTNLPPPGEAPINQFVEAVAGKTGLALVTPREAATRVSVMEAAYKGASTHTWVAPT